MTPERHQRIGELYHRALELPPERHEAGDFIEAPAFEIAAAALAARPQLTALTSLGPYGLAGARPA